MSQDSLNKITTVIAQQYDRQQDEPFKRSLEVRIKAWRSKLIRDTLEKHPDQRKFFTQTIFVPLACYDRIACRVIDSPSNIMRSTRVLPVPLRFGNTLFDYVGSVDGRSPFNYAVPGATQLNEHSKYARFHTQWEWENQFILLSKRFNINIRMIRVDGVFDDPADIFLYNCNEGNCDYWDLPYPVSNDIKQMIIQYINQVDFNKDKTTTPSTQEVEVDPGNPKNIKA